MFASYPLIHMCTHNIYENAWSFWGYIHTPERTVLKFHRFEILMFSTLSLGVTGLAWSTLCAVDDSWSKVFWCLSKTQGEKGRQKIIKRIWRWICLVAAEDGLKHLAKMFEKFDFARAQTSSIEVKNQLFCGVREKISLLSREFLHRCKAEVAY